MKSEGEGEGEGADVLSKILECVLLLRSCALEINTR